MFSRFWVKALLAVLLLCVLPERVSAYGDGAFLSLQERQLLLLANEARCNVAQALSECKRCGEASCYETSLAPLYEDGNLSRAARFHAQIMHESSCFEHHSPCKLKDDVGKTYPGCHQASCACKGEVLCDNLGDTAYERTRKFYTKSKTIGENIAMSTMKDAEYLFKIWLLEPSTTTQCVATEKNGHRWALLYKDFDRTGLGFWEGYAVQNFAAQGSVPKSAMSSGVHFERPWGVLFKAHWYWPEELADFQLNIDGQCVPMAVSRQGAGLVLAYEGVGLKESFSYRFEAQDKSGKIHYYPSKGALVRGGVATWTEKKLKGCAGLKKGARGEELEQKKPAQFVPGRGVGEQSEKNPCDACIECGACRLRTACKVVDGVEKDCITSAHCEQCPL